MIQPAYVIREETLLPETDLNHLQKKKAGPEAIIVVCKACAENCFVRGRVSFKCVRSSRNRRGCVVVLNLVTVSTLFPA